MGMKSTIMYLHNLFFYHCVTRVFLFTIFSLGARIPIKCLIRSNIQYTPLRYTSEIGTIIITLLQTWKPRHRKEPARAGRWRIEI